MKSPHVGPTQYCHELTALYWAPSLERLYEPVEACELCHGRPPSGWICLACCHAEASTLERLEAIATAEERRASQFKLVSWRLAEHRPRRADGSRGFGPLTDADVEAIRSGPAAWWLDSEDFRDAVEAGWVRFAGS